MSDPNTRRLCLPKLTYSKYCGKCEFCVKAEWNKNEGVKYGIIDVVCCVNGGKFGLPACPYGIAYNVELGQVEEFSPEDWKERFKSPKPLLYGEEYEPDGKQPDGQTHLGRRRNDR